MAETNKNKEARLAKEAAAKVAVEAEAKAQRIIDVANNAAAKIAENAKVDAEAKVDEARKLVKEAKEEAKKENEANAAKIDEADEVVAKVEAQRKIDEAKIAAETDDSKRVKCIVTRKLDNVTATKGSARIFSSAVIKVKGKRVLKWFKIPEGQVLEVPVEIIAQLRGRKISKNMGGGYKMVPEFSVELVG